MKIRLFVTQVGVKSFLKIVAKGYARNYLIPRWMALEATEKNIKLTEMQRKNIENKRIQFIVSLLCERIREMKTMAYLNFRQTNTYNDV